MDKAWIKEPTKSQAYKVGVESFMKYARTTAVQGTIPCPCLKCCNLKRWACEVVHGHILVHGFLPGYTTWTFHGEEVSSQYDTPYMKKMQSQTQSKNAHETPLGAHDIKGMLQDIMGFNSLNWTDEPKAKNVKKGQASGEKRPGLSNTRETNQFQKLLEECDESFIRGVVTQNWPSSYTYIT